MPPLLPPSPGLGAVSSGGQPRSMLMSPTPLVLRTDGPLGRISYRDVYHQNEVEQSKYNFVEADIEHLFNAFDHAEHESERLIDAGLALPAYERMLEASHLFNLLDARRAISVSERQRFILRVRELAQAVAEGYYRSREALGFPMLETGGIKGDAA